MDDPRRLLAKEWETVERLIAATCRKRGLPDADADEFASMVKVKLFENDCEIIRRFRRESKFSTYLNIIVQHTFGDFCTRRLGKWHASAAATRGGPIALELERLVYREGTTPDEAIARLRTAHPGVSHEELTELLAGLPRRQRRPTTVSLEGTLIDLADDRGADVLVMEAERHDLSARAAAVIRPFLERLPVNDRLLLQFHFESDMPLAEISRMLRIEQKPLYRRRGQLLSELQEGLLAAGITAAEIADLIGHIPEETDFGLRKKEELRPTESEDGVTVPPEIPT